MLKQVTGRFSLSRFGPESFRPGSVWPGSIRPWVISAQFGGSFRPIFSRSHDISSEAVRPILFIFHI